MLHWTQVRNITQLREFIDKFSELPKEERAEITTEMVIQLNLYKAKDAQIELFEESDRQVAGLVLTERSTRRKRGARRPRR